MTKALILAAGQGTRLRPLTDDRPKCLVNFCGEALLNRQAATLKECDISEICVATGYRSDLIRKLGFATMENPSYETTNMVESLFCASDFIEKEGDLIIAYGDIIYNKENLISLMKCEEEVSLMIDSNWRDLWSLRFEDPLDDAETLLMSEDGFVRELGKKPLSYEQIQGQYTGLIKIREDKKSDLIDFYNKLDRDVLYDGKDFKNMYMTSFLQLLIDNHWKVKAVEVCNGWLEIDSVEDLETYEGMASRGELDRFFKL
jgi:L-glutamine-phosphate cytidylyltransferase